MPYKKEIEKTKKLIDDLVLLWCEDYVKENFHIFENNTVVRKSGGKYKAITMEDMVELGRHFYYMGIKTVKETSKKKK